MEQVDWSPSAPRREPVRVSVTVVVFALGYTLAVWLGNRLATPSGFAVFWPASGVALAAFLSVPSRRWPLLAATIVLTTVVVTVAQDLRPGVALLFGAIDACEAALAASVVGRFSPGRLTLESRRQMVAIVLGAAVAANAVTTTAAAAVAVWLLGAGFRSFWLLWFVSNGVGMIVVAPLVLTWLAVWRRLPTLLGWRGVELAAILASVAAVAGWTFGLVGDGTNGHAFAFFVFPILLWPALRLGPAGTALAAFELVVVAVAGILNGGGPFAPRTASPEAAALLNQLYLAIATLSALIPSTVVAEHRRLRLAAERYRLLSEHARDPMLVVRRSDGRILLANPAAIDLYGYDHEELRARTVMDLRVRTERDLVPAQMSTADTDGALFEATHLRRDGSAVPVEISSRGVTTGGERVLISVVRDISRRRRDERQIVYANRLYAVLSQINEMIVRTRDRQSMLDRACRIAVDAGAFQLAWIGVVADDRRAVTVASVAGDRVPFAAGAVLSADDFGGGPVARAVSSGEAVISNDLLADATTPDAQSLRETAGVRSGAAVPLKVDGEIVGVMGLYAADAGFFTPSEVRLLEALGADVGFALESIARDERARRAEQATVEAHRRFRSVFEHANDVILLLEGGRFVECNPAAERLFGLSRDNLLGRRPEDVSPPTQADSRPSAQAALDRLVHAMAGTPQYFEWTHRRADGTPLDVEIGLNRIEVEGRPVLLAVLRDLTERRRLEAQLHQARRMESIGRLAGGIAHDFNNLLTVIGGYADQIASTLEERDPRRGQLAEVQRAAERAGTLTRQLLAFGRRQFLQPVVLDLNAVVVEMQQMLGRTIGESIDVILALDDRLPHVFADADQIKQIVVNLALNARDAMPDGGRLTLRTAHTALDEVASRSLDLRPGPFVQLAVSDTGRGIADDDRLRIFEPFYSTGSIGRRAGMGLPTVYGVARQSGGTVAVESTVGSGSTFTVYLPAVIPRSTDSVGDAPTGIARGTEAVLLVEDDDLVRGLVQRMLERLGYTVLSAASGSAALDLLDRHETPIDLLLTDVVMPQMGGRTLAERVTARHPSVRVLYMSGYADDEIVRQGIALAGLPLVQKPFALEGLGRAVREVLDA